MTSCGCGFLNLVSVYGSVGDFRDQMEKGSLDVHLFMRRITPLSWKSRVQITVGIAEALSFLERTQNLDDYLIITPEKIMLDKDLNAKISGAEFANLAYVDLHTTNDPLYYHPAILNVSDYHRSRASIGAFGHILIQILTGKRDFRIGLKNIREHVKNRRRKCLKESLRKALDPRLPNVDRTAIKAAIKLVGVALSCLDDPSYTLNSALDELRQL